jgi:subtilisin
MSDKPRLPWHEIHFQATSDELNQRLPYNIKNYKIDELWDDVDYGEGIRIGVADTGISSFHRTDGDLHGAIVDARDFTGSTSGVEDMSGHGTHVAGTIGARYNDFGIAGVLPRCSIYVAKVLGDSGMGENRWVSQGIRYLVDSGCQIINLSLGSPANDDGLASAIEYGVKNGVLFICAAGNDGLHNSVNYPARWSTNIAVGAIDRNLNLARFSSRGNQLDICGPGVEILSCYKGTTYSSISGTSMASPWVAGAAGMFLKLSKKYNIPLDLTNLSVVRDLYKRFAVDLGAPGKDPEFGYGVLNVNQTCIGLKAMATIVPDPTPQPDQPAPDPSPIPRSGRDMCYALMDVLERCSKLDNKQL